MQELNDLNQCAYVLAKIEKYQKHSGHGRNSTFVGTVLSFLSSPLALRMVLPGDRIWFRRWDVIQIPLALNERLKEPLRDRRRLARYEDYWAGRRSMVEKLPFGLGAAPRARMGVKATRLTDWGGQLLDQKARSLVGPGHIVRAQFATPLDDPCQHIGGCNYFVILAVDHGNPEYLWAEYFDNSATQTVPDGIVLRIPRSTIFEIPTSWNPPELEGVVDDDGTNHRVAITGPGSKRRDYIDLGSPTDWIVPRDL